MVQHNHILRHLGGVVHSLCAHIKYATMNSEREYLTFLLQGYRRMYWRGRKPARVMVRWAYGQLKHMSATKL